jgi:hypothetical protein
MLKINISTECKEITWERAREREREREREKIEYLNSV